MSTTDTAAASAAPRAADDAARITDLVDDLFEAMEDGDWDRVPALLDDEIEVDHTSLTGGAPVRLTRAQLIARWRAALHPGKTNAHVLGRCRVRVRGTYATARFSCHVLNALEPALGGAEWEAWGRHTLTLRRDRGVWRVAGMDFATFHTRGDVRAYTHTAGSAAPERGDG
ncbi:nuclear transport factor 2 family protein [Streptomyces flaveolus]|jgi:ketosteroid isomerase-like protein|uniref:nuclear transport factor 2 family protein n=1 Tax=Streptomyces flaveolus TaxID=67297 RepID=UPI0033A89C98